MRSERRQLESETFASWLRHAMWSLCAGSNWRKVKFRKWNCEHNNNHSQFHHYLLMAHEKLLCSGAFLSEVFAPHSLLLAMLRVCFTLLAHQFSQIVWRYHLESCQEADKRLNRSESKSPRSHWTIKAYRVSRCLLRFSALSLDTTRLLSPLINQIFAFPR